MLKIAFMGYNARHTADSLRLFAVDNADQVKSTDWNRGRIVLFDGTEITAIYTPDALLGRRFDQAIIADDHRAAVYERYIYMTDALHQALRSSKVPYEWQVQIYDLDAEVAEK